MISLKKKLLEIKDPTSDNYTAELKNIIFDKIYGKKEEMYYAILKKEGNDLKLRFSAFIVYLQNIEGSNKNISCLIW